MSATNPDQPGTPSDSGGLTPVSSRWDLTVRPPTPNRPLARALTDPNFQQTSSSERTRLLATKHPKYWDPTDSETEERGRGARSTAGARSGEW